MADAEHEFDFELTKDTSYPTGEVWGVYYEDFREIWSRYNGTALNVDGSRQHWGISNALAMKIPQSWASPSI